MNTCPDCGHPLVEGLGGPGVLACTNCGIIITQHGDDECALCHTQGGHAEGCPNAGPAMVMCGHCPTPTPIPLAEMSGHLAQEHDVDMPQDELEESYLGARDGFRELFQHAVHQQRANMSASEALPIGVGDIWEAIGYHAVTRQWPDHFRVDAGLFVAMDLFRKAADTANQHVDRLVEKDRLIEELQAVIEERQIQDIADAQPDGDEADGDDEEPDS